MAIELNKQESAEAIASIKRFFCEEWEQELSDLQAGFLLSYIIKEIGPLAYNQGVKDAENYFRAKLEDLSATCFEDGLTYWSKRRKSRGQPASEE